MAANTSQIENNELPSKSICYIVGAGENYGLHFTVRKGDYVIAADEGFRFLEQKGIRADLVVGDFDSLQYEPQHPNVIALAKEKDDTDMRVAVREGIRAGYECFHIYCGTGGRIDHTLANIQLLAELAGSGKAGFLFASDCAITAVRNITAVFPAGLFGYLSVLSLSDVSRGVFLKGLKYELEDAVLTNTLPLGVSNEFTGKESRITVKNGTLLLIFPIEAAERCRITFET